MKSATLPEAPADRPPGERGWRGKAAFVVAVAAVPFFAMSSVADAWERAAYLAVAAALVTAATLTWTARRTPALVLAGVAVAASAMAVVLIDFPNSVHAQGVNRGAEVDYSYDPDGRAITRGQAEAVPKGSTEDEVEEVLGSAAGDGTMRRRDGTDSRCLVYGDQASREPHHIKFVFCFADDRYASLHRW